MAARRTLAPLCALLLLLVAGAASCAEDDPEVKIAPSASPTPASASPSEAAETPEEFIRRWAELDKAMQNSGETADYAAATGSCVPCADLVTTIESIYAKGGYVHWDGRRIERIKKIAPLSFEVWVTSSPTRYKRARGAEEEKLDGGPSKYRLTLVEADGRFSLADIVERPL